MNKMIVQCDVCKGEIEPQRDVSGKIFWEGGHNPWPIIKDNNGALLPDDARCCDDCNAVALVERLRTVYPVGIKERAE